MRAAARPACRSAVSWPSDGHIVAQAQPYRGRVLAVSWPLAAHPCLLCHDTIPLYRDLNWKLGSSPFQLPATFFFHIIFFSHSSYWKTTKKKHFFSFSSKSNKFIKIYFIFFPSFTHCKTLKKKISHHFFFHLILDYLPKISQPPKVLISPMLFIKHTST